MKREHLQLGELAARTTPVFVIENNKIIITTLYEHVIKSAFTVESKFDSINSYTFVRDRLFPIDNSRDTLYYMRYKEAEDALFLAAGQATDR